MNCAHYHGCLAEEEPSYYHIHDYCDAWDRTNMGPMNSLINSFLDDYCNKFDCLFDDNETGESYCYRFDEVEGEELDNDIWMKNNFDHNKQLALALLDKIILDGKCYNNILEKEEELDTESLKYFRNLRKKIKAIN